ncbi:Uncharacterised protein [Enterobacter cloacae]|nr:hypothetical protein PAERUG_E15_London_28_01_14_09657 [Pseudomonas aeruginosa]SAJ34657.1 Uncharacterised protein [Enterobacter cloacae]
MPPKSSELMIFTTVCRLRSPPTTPNGWPPWRAGLAMVSTSSWMAGSM